MNSLILLLACSLASSALEEKMIMESGNHGSSPGFSIGSYSITPAAGIVIGPSGVAVTTAIGQPLAEESSGGSFILYSGTLSRSRNLCDADQRLFCDGFESGTPSNWSAAAGSSQVSSSDD